MARNQLNIAVNVLQNINFISHYNEKVWYAYDQNGITQFGGCWMKPWQLVLGPLY